MIMRPLRPTGAAKQFPNSVAQRCPVIRIESLHPGMLRYLNLKYAVFNIYGFHPHSLVRRIEVQPTTSRTFSTKNGSWKA